MTEEEIQQELLAKTKTESAIPQDGWEKVEPAKNPDEQFINQLPPENQLERMKFFDYFGLSSADTRTPEADKALTAILDWAREEAGSSEYTDMLRVINDQERMMGNKLKPGRLTNLYRFAVIHRNRMRLLEEERTLYG